eukprot:41585_1
MTQHIPFTKRQLLSYCNQIGIAGINVRDSKAKIITSILNYNINTNNIQNIYNNIQNELHVLSQTRTRIDNQMLQLQNVQHQLTVNTRTPSSTQHRWCSVLNIMLVVIFIVLLWLLFWEYLVVYKCRKSLTNCRLERNVCINQAALYDPAYTLNIAKHRNIHLNNLGISEDIIQFVGRPNFAEMYLFTDCTGCDINLWTAKKLIRLCEKKYHTDTYSRYNYGAKIPDALKKRYNEQFNKCQEAKHFLQNETMLGASILHKGYSAQCDPTCWSCFNVDVKEFEKYDISIETDPKCNKYGLYDYDPAIDRKREFVKNNKILRHMCTMEGHLNLQELL